MNFKVLPPGTAQYGRHPTYPCAFLEEDNWNDYSFRTLFALDVYLPPDGRRVVVGQVKICRLGQSEGEHAVPADFDELGDDFVSLGQDSTYYEVMATLPSSVREDLLASLQDAVWFPHKKAQFADEPVWSTSLLRFGGAQNALLTARTTLGSEIGVGDEAGERSFTGFSVVSSAGGNPFQVRFTFESDAFQASRLNAIIGYNGTGKTTLLAKLARLAHADERRRGETKFREEVGHFISTVPSFAAVIMVSYSAFDSFRLPGWEGGQERDQAERKDGEVFGYSYCGLRETERSEESNAPTHPRKPTTLKSSEHLRDEFSATLLDIRRVGRQNILTESLLPLSLEPSFAGTGALTDLTNVVEGEVGAYFDQFSSGHKIALTILAHLVRRLQPHSLVLIDEPEAHLHPSLLASLLTSLAGLLERFDSQVIVATHSPVVLQEVPALCVNVLRRNGTQTIVVRPDIETFGENVALISSHVFHLEGGATDHHAVLDRMAEELTLEEAEARFTSGLSMGARSYFLSQRQGRS